MLPSSWSANWSNLAPSSSTRHRYSLLPSGSPPAEEQARLPYQQHVRHDSTAFWKQRMLGSYAVKAASTLAQATVLILALAAAVLLGQMRSKHLIWQPHYSLYDISQAGIARPYVTYGTVPPEHNATTAALGAANATASRATRVSLFDMDETSDLAGEIESTAIASNTESNTSDDMHLSILTPLKNAAKSLSTYFQFIEALDHPKANTSIGFLIGDDEDETPRLVTEWTRMQNERGDYRAVTIVKKRFGVLTPGGGARHEGDWQAQRRAIMGRARTLLLQSTISPDIDWVLWLDCDVSELPKTLFRDLLLFGHASPDGPADIICPNVMNRDKHGQINGYDYNNWANTDMTLAMLQKLDKDVILHEDLASKTPSHRRHLATAWTRPSNNETWNRKSPDYVFSRWPEQLAMTSNGHGADHVDSEDAKVVLSHATKSTSRRNVAISSPNGKSPSSKAPNNLYDPSSPAYIGRTMALDGVGGAVTLVRASVHLYGAVFPSYGLEHQIETEGFGVMAGKIGARIVGLMNYLVFHS